MCGMVCGTASLFLLNCCPELLFCGCCRCGCGMFSGVVYWFPESMVRDSVDAPGVCGDSLLVVSGTSRCGDLVCEHGKW